MTQPAASRAHNSADKCRASTVARSKEPGATGDSRSSASTAATHPTSAAARLVRTRATTWSTACRTSAAKFARGLSIAWRGKRHPRLQHELSCGQARCDPVRCPNHADHSSSLVDRAANHVVSDGSLHRMGESQILPTDKETSQINRPSRQMTVRQNLKQIFRSQHFL